MRCTHQVISHISLRELIMRPLDLDIKHRLMEIPLPPRLLQHLHLLVLQPPPSQIFQLFPTNLCANLFCFLVFVLRLEARLHAQAHFGGWRDFVCVSTDCGRCGICIDTEVGVAHGAQGEETWLCWGGLTFEGFFGRDGFAGC